MYLHVYPTPNSQFWTVACSSLRMIDTGGQQILNGHCADKAEAMDIATTLKAKHSDDTIIVHSEPPRSHAEWLAKKPAVH